MNFVRTHPWRVAALAALVSWLLFVNLADDPVGMIIGHVTVAPIVTNFDVEASDADTTQVRIEGVIEVENPFPMTAIMRNAEWTLFLGDEAVQMAIAPEGHTVDYEVPARGSKLIGFSTLIPAERAEQLFARAAAGHVASVHTQGVARLAVFGRREEVEFVTEPQELDLTGLDLDLAPRDSVDLATGGTITMEQAVFDGRLTGEEAAAVEAVFAERMEEVFAAAAEEAAADAAGEGAAGDGAAGEDAAGEQEAEGLDQAAASETTDAE